MIYAHNKGITGINVHSFPMERVYKGSRLVWLRNSTDDYFTIVGDPFIVAGREKTYRIKYHGSDDISYTWSFNGVDRSMISVIYNHNMKKATIKINAASKSEYLIITVAMKRKDKPYLYAQKILNIVDSGKIDSFNINDVWYDLNDDSVFVPFIILPSELAETCTVYSSSISDSSLNLSNISYMGLDIVKDVNMNRGTTAKLNVSLLDDYIIPEEDLPDASTFEIVETVSQASGDYDEIYVTSVGKYYEKNNNGNYEEYGVLQQIYGSYELNYITKYPGKLVYDSNNYKEYKCDGSSWIEYDYIYSKNTPALGWSGEGKVSIPILFHWDTGYKMELRYSVGNYDATKGSRILGGLFDYYITPTASIQATTSPFTYMIADGDYGRWSTPSDSLVADSSVFKYVFNNNWGTRSVSHGQHIINKATFQNTIYRWFDDETGAQIDAGGSVKTITGWYDGSYGLDVELTNNQKENFVELKIFDANNVTLNDFVPSISFDGSINRPCIIDKMSGECFFASTENDPDYNIIDHGTKILPYRYDHKYPVDSLLETEDGWKEIYKASANVYTFKTTRSFTINGQDAGEGFDPKGRLQLGFVIRSSYNRLSVYGVWNIGADTYGIYKAHAKEDRYYCTWGCEYMSQHDIKQSTSSNVYVNWVQYNDGEHPFIPYVIDNYDNTVMTWFRWYLGTPENPHATGRDMDLDTASVDVWNHNLDTRYQTMVFTTITDSVRGMSLDGSRSSILYL